MEIFSRFIGYSRTLSFQNCQAIVNLDNVHEDLVKVSASQNVVVFAEKSTNVQQTTPEHYKKMLHEYITEENQKLDNQNIIDNINWELKEVTSNLTIGNSVDTGRVHISKRS